MNIDSHSGAIRIYGGKIRPGLVELDSTATGLKFDIPYDSRSTPILVNVFKAVVPHFYRSYSPNSKVWTVHGSFIDELSATMQINGLIDEESAAAIRLFKNTVVNMSDGILRGEISVGASKDYKDSGMKGAFASISEVPGDPFALFFPHLVLWEWFVVNSGKKKEAIEKEEKKVDLVRLRSAVESKDALAILDLDENSSVDDARQAFHRFALLTHPDRGGDPRLFIAVKEAYEKVKDPKYIKKRKAMITAGIIPELRKEDLKGRPSHQPRPVLYKPPYQSGIVELRAERIMHKHLVKEILDWRL